MMQRRRSGRCQIVGFGREEGVKIFSVTSAGDRPPLLLISMTTVFLRVCAT